MANIIKQIVNGNDDAQTIKMIVQPAERGPQGPQGPRGPQGPQGLQGLRGEDGVIHYRAGVGIKISDDNFISATGEAIATWGGIEGDINDQADLQQEFSQYEKSADLATVAESGDYNDLTNKPSINNATLTIQNDGTTVETFTANSSTDATANIVPPVKVGTTISVPDSTVQLTDKNDNNIYPLTNKVVDGTITTNSITDDAIIPSKIDFSTFNVILSAITIRGSYSDATAPSNTQISLDTVQASYGNKLTLSSNGVKIGAGVSRVLVTASAFYSFGDQNYAWCKVYKNSTATGYCAITNIASSYGSATIPLSVLDVQEDDIIKLWNVDSAKVRGNSSFLTVIAIN
jgi:hypothetical protein